MKSVDERTPGQLLREARERRGVSQRRLAIRAGTTQSAISRIEHDQISPSFETMRNLLHMLGEDLVVDSIERDAGIDRPMVVESLAMTPADRVKRGLSRAEFVRRNRGGMKTAA